jgi:hypothetical protein
MTSGSSIGFNEPDLDINDVQKYYEKSTSREKMKERALRSQTKEAKERRNKFKV